MLLFQKQCKTYNLSKLGNVKERHGIRQENCWNRCQIPSLPRKTHAFLFLLECWKSLPVKYSIEKPVLLNLVNLTTMFCVRLSEETFSSLTHLKFNGIYIFCRSQYFQTRKIYSHLKAVFGGIELQQR